MYLCRKRSAVWKLASRIIRQEPFPRHAVACVLFAPFRAHWLQPSARRLRLHLEAMSGECDFSGHDDRAVQLRAVLVAGLFAAVAAGGDHAAMLQDTLQCDRDNLANPRRSLHFSANEKPLIVPSRDFERERFVTATDAHSCGLWACNRKRRSSLIRDFRRIPTFAKCRIVSRGPSALCIFSIFGHSSNGC